MASFFTPASKKEPEKMTWRVVHNALLVGRYKPETGSLDQKVIPPKRRKIAAFDFVCTTPTLSPPSVCSQLDRILLLYKLPQATFLVETLRTGSGGMPVCQLY